MEINVGNEKRELRIEYFRETGLNAMKSNFTYMNWLEERHIKQLALFSVSQQRELLRSSCDWCNGNATSNTEDDYGISDLG